MKPIKLTDLIIAESDDFVILNKPYGVASSVDRSGDISIPALIEKAKLDWKAIHRTDKNTSGILVLAKNDVFYRHFSMLMEHRKVTKLYHAIVDGLASFKELLVKKNILYKADHVLISKDGKSAVTILNTKAMYKYHTLVECKPITGRMHQIRIHLADAGYPIVADSLYGGKEVFLSQIKKNFNLKQWTEEKPLISRHALHAFSIGFEGLNKENLYFEAEYPKDIRALVTQLEKSM